jgi:hypothetical protein
MSAANEISAVELMLFGEAPISPYSSQIDWLTRSMKRLI